MLGAAPLGAVMPGFTDVDGVDTGFAKIPKSAEARRRIWYADAHTIPIFLRASEKSGLGWDRVFPL